MLDAFAAETSWPDVGLEFVKFLTYLAGVCAALYVQYRQLQSHITAVRSETARVAEMGGANSVKLERVEGGLKENTALTAEVKKAVDGGSKCGWSDPALTISGRMTAFQQAMVTEIAALKEELVEGREEIKQLKAELTEARKEKAV